MWDTFFLHFAVNSHCQTGFPHETRKANQRQLNATSDLRIPDLRLLPLALAASARTFDALQTNLR